MCFVCKFDLWQLVQQPLEKRVRVPAWRREATTRRTCTRTRADPAATSLPEFPTGARMC